jgi:SH3-like domain-containing protein
VKKDPVKSPPRSHRFLGVAFLAILLLFSACNRGRNKVQEIAYVSAPQVFLRDQVSAVYNKTGTVKNGDRLQVLERERRFVRVRTDSGAEGWMEQRYLVPQKVFDQFQQMAQREQGTPVQVNGVTRNETNLHVDPGRDTEHLYQVPLGAKVAILKRATAEKSLPAAAPKAPNPVGKGPASPPGPVLEDWWLVRDPQGHVGWVLARMVDLDVPLDIAQYAEGQRIVAFFVLNAVSDGDKKVPQYLMLLTEPKDGLPFDYNQMRVFTWNVKRHRYETAYREHNLDGVLPVTVGQENFDKEGMLPVFVLHVRNDEGVISERKYKLNTPIVRRVLAPGEEPPKAGKKKRH